MSTFNRRRPRRAPKPIIRTLSLADAIETLRQPGREIVHLHLPLPEGGHGFFVVPDGGRVNNDTAEKILQRADVQPFSELGCFPKCAELAHGSRRRHDEEPIPRSRRAPDGGAGQGPHPRRRDAAQQTRTARRRTAQAQRLLQSAPPPGTHRRARRPQWREDQGADRQLDALTIETIPQLAAFVRAGGWPTAAANTLFLVRRMAGKSVVRLREKDGLPPFDDSLPGEPVTPEQDLRDAFTDQPERAAPDQGETE